MGFIYICAEKGLYTMNDIWGRLTWWLHEGQLMTTDWIESTQRQLLYPNHDLGRTGTGVWDPRIEWLKMMMVDRSSERRAALKTLWNFECRCLGEWSINRNREVRRRRWPWRKGLKSFRTYNCKIHSSLKCGSSTGNRCNTDSGGTIVEVVVRDWRYHYRRELWREEKTDSLEKRTLSWGSKRKKIRTQSREEKGPESRSEPG